VATLGQTTIYLVEERDNPSSAYFLVPALTALGGRVVRCGLKMVPADLTGAVVVLVRYVSPAWTRAVTRFRSRLAGLIFFMDDDVLDPTTWAGTPWRYRYKLWRLAARQRGWLRRQAAALWVSTPPLRDKYAAAGARLVAPSPLPEEASRQVLFYHSTASHGPDIRWLQPVVRRVLAVAPDWCFETVGDRTVARLYRGLAGAWVVHPLSWPAYQGFATTGARHIGLAPQLETPFNRSRSFTKFFDITRSGAVGVYAAGSACAAVVEDGLDGLVVPMDREAWLNAILTLARDPQRRQAMLAQARDKTRRLEGQARQAYTALWSPTEVQA